MAIKTPTDPKSLLSDKRALQQAMAKLNARLGFVPDPDSTPEKVREMMRRDDAGGRGPPRREHVLSRDHSNALRRGLTGARAAVGCQRAGKIGCCRSASAPG